MIVELSVEQILKIHEAQIREFGGAAGSVRLGSVESAVGRLSSGYYNDHVEMAAALWESLTQNHPFLDGNKRTAFAAMRIFLEVNGFALEHDRDETYEFIIGLMEAGEFKRANLEVWIREHVVASDPTN